MKPIFLYPVIFLLLASGCSVAKHREQLGTLSAVGKSAQDIEDRSARHIENFEKLKKDIEDKRLKKGSKKSEILKRYGQPVLYLETRNDKEASEKLLYRRPSDYFSDDRVYLYFGKSGKLVKWE